MARPEGKGGLEAGVSPSFGPHLCHTLAVAPQAHLSELPILVCTVRATMSDLLTSQAVVETEWCIIRVR